MHRLLFCPYTSIKNNLCEKSDLITQLSDTTSWLLCLTHVPADDTLINIRCWLRLVCPFCPPVAYLVTQRLLPEEPRSRRLMTSDQDTKVVAEPQVQQVQEAKENSHLVSVTRKHSCFSVELYTTVLFLLEPPAWFVVVQYCSSMCWACMQTQSFREL